MQRLNGMLGQRWVVAAVLAAGSLASVACADDSVKKHEQSTPVAATDEGVSEAVRASVADEIVGDEKSRATRLDAAIEANPDASEPHWQRGLMKTADGWREAAVCQAEVTDAEKKYRELRDHVADDLAGNKQLARFCQKNKLTDNARGHWLRVVSFSPDDAEARKALRHVRFEGTWTTKEGVKRVEKVRKEYHASMMAWSKKIPGWIDNWHSDDAKRKEKGRVNLVAIRDAAAIPLLNAGLMYRSEDDMVLLVEILSAIPDIQSTRTIAELAVANPSPQIFRSCIEELKERDEQAFAPQLLLALSSPLTSEMRLDINPNTGRILYRHVFAQEGQFTRQVQAIGLDYGTADVQTFFVYDDGTLNAANTRYQAPSVAGVGTMQDVKQWEKLLGTPDQQQDAMFAWRAAQSMAAAMERERRKALQNLSVEETNRRVSSVLSGVFGDNNGTPDQWWSWWNQRHETQQIAQKPTSVQVQYEQVVDGVQTPSVISGTQARELGLVHCGCFVQGTQVATPEGLRPIDSIKTGDLVLAQDVETGEIAWKPVIQPTKRPATECLKLVVGDEVFVCTLKHPFWKVGRGWVWAKELAVGDLVRTSNGSLPITEIEEQPNAPVFNLIVSDFSTYFVGKNRTLTHDITYRKPTLAIAPGVLPAKEEVASK